MKFLRKRNPLSIIHAPRRLDDDGSVSSTFTAERLTKLSTDLECEKPRTNSTVKFDFGNNVEYSSGALSDEEKLAVWYTQEEYKKFKSSFVELAREFHKYDKANPDPESFKIMLSKAFNACAESTDYKVKGLLDGNTQKALQRWFRFVSTVMLQLF